MGMFNFRCLPGGLGWRQWVKIRSSSWDGGGLCFRCKCGCKHGPFACKQGWKPRKEVGLTRTEGSGSRVGGAKSWIETQGLPSAMSGRAGGR